MPDLLSIYDLTRKEAESLLAESARMDSALSRSKPPGLLRGKVVSNLFFESSTRTNSSFQAASARLGAYPIVFHPEKSSLSKGESFSDTIRMFDGYSDAIIIRHPEAGSASRAAQIASHPVINAGDGGNQHPTQTLIDLYTIKKLKGRVSNLNITLIGDLKYARAMRSLLYGLALFGQGATLVSPPSLRMDSSVISLVRKEFGVDVKEASKPDLKNCDVLYACRIQKERFSDQKEAEREASLFRLSAEMLKPASKDMAVLHPLPKIDEIPPEFDSDPRAKYFEQAKNGVPVRMAVLVRCVLGR
jgi:aspartate carbamoyltransferase catalytic subunit